MIKALWTTLPSVLLVLAASWVAGCGSVRRGVPTGPPLALTDSTLVRGQRVFMRFCNGCHPGGTGGVGLSLNNKPLSGFVIRYQVRHGLGAMPAFSKEVIPDGDLDALTGFVKALRDHSD